MKFNHHTLLQLESLQAKASYIYTHTCHHHRVDSFCLQQGIKKQFKDKLFCWFPQHKVHLYIKATFYSVLVFSSLNSLPVWFLCFPASSNNFRPVSLWSFKSLSLRILKIVFTVSVKSTFSAVDKITRNKCNNTSS